MRVTKEDLIIGAQQVLKYHTGHYWLQQEGEPEDAWFYGMAIGLEDMVSKVSSQTKKDNISNIIRSLLEESANHGNQQAKKHLMEHFQNKPDRSVPN
jgi:hypothetical protein